MKTMVTQTDYQRISSILHEHGVRYQVDADYTIRLKGEKSSSCMSFHFDKKGALTTTRVRDVISHGEGE
jgi:extradiol dioxygenase family protein